MPRAPKKPPRTGLNIRLTPADLERAQARATAAGTTVSDLVRRYLAEDGGAERAAYLAGYQSALREAAGAVERLSESMPAIRATLGET